MLDGNEHQRIWELIGECHDAKIAADLELLIHRFRKLLSHEMAFCGIVNVGTNEVIAHLNVGCPTKMLSALLNGTNKIHDPFFETWKRMRSPYFAETERFGGTEAQSCPLLSRWLRILREFGVTNAMVHGLMDISGRVTSYFSFIQLPHPAGDRERDVLSALVPHLHAALINILQSPRADAPAARDGGRGGEAFNMLNRGTNDNPGATLTSRELEVLRWAYAGKTNWEIGTILGITEFTVKNHMRSIMQKLRASNRAHAVAKAVDAKLLYQFAK